ncbi:MAG: alpha/beta hydrolase fold domain-containing protein, partial [Thermoguttaceae bacterium]|nr:alpha/beta hydrolase fold domain-containing protein [Thermoguttaceae bacterium]
MKSSILRTTVFFFAFAALSVCLSAAEPQTPATRLERNIPYYSVDKMKNADDYMKQRCVLDLLYPTGKKGYATVVWFHGGGLVNGTKGMPPFKSLDAFKEGRLALVGCGYRLSPQVPYPVFLEDAAAAVA